MRRFYVVVCAVVLCLLSSCEGTTFRSSVPLYPVRVEIDTRTYVSFTPENMGSYIIVDKDYYYLDGKPIQPTTVKDACGYGGVLVYIGMNGYEAYDLACPYCAGRGKKCPCRMDVDKVVCDECGEEYSLGMGIATPRKGISKEAMRSLYVNESTYPVVIITQRP